jgi:hypothetical protein
MRLLPQFVLTPQHTQSAAVDVSVVDRGGVALSRRVVDHAIARAKAGGDLPEYL